MNHPVDVAALQAAVTALPDTAWSKPSTYAGTGVHHGYRRVVLVDAGRWTTEGAGLRFVVGLFDPVWSAWLSRIDPGGFIVPHRDAAPWRERWQVPVYAAGVFDGYDPQDGVPFQVRHWRPHAVWNDTVRPRIHVVIDRDVIVDVGAPGKSFATFPIPAERAGMVAQAGQG